MSYDYIMLRRFCSAFRRAMMTTTVTGLRPSVLQTSTCKRCATPNLSSRFVSTTSSKTADNPPAARPSNGDEAFRSYQQAHQKMEQFRKEKERQKSEEMFRAWQRQQQQPATSSSSSSSQSTKAGVAVVQTLAKQTRRKAPSEIEQYKLLAETMLQQAADMGHGQALVILGNQSFQKAQVAKESDAEEKIQHALELYQKAGQAGASEGWFNYGHLLWTGYPDLSSSSSQVALESTPQILEPDPNAAMQAFLNAVELGDADAMYFVGVHKLSNEEDDDDDDTLDDFRSGLALIEQASSQEHSGALYYLALLHLNGHEKLGIAPCTNDEFVARLDAAANAGAAEALFLRGHCYYAGENGYEQDYQKGLENFLMAADAGSADAAISAGAILVQGHPGIARDPVRAFELYQHAGELGSLDGWRNVVDCYVNGIGVPRSIETARYISQTMLKEDIDVR